MSGLDTYDPEGVIKWHHFAFRADAGRVGKLRTALEAWISLRDRVPLERFVSAHRLEWVRAEAKATIAVDPQIFASLLAHAASVDVDPAAVRARIAALGARMPRTLHERVLEFPRRAAELRRMRKRKAAKEIVDLEIARMREILALDDRVIPWADTDDFSATSRMLDFSSLFDTAIELAVREPWADNVGLGRMYELVSDDFPLPAATELVSSSWPVHYENVDGAEPCVYGDNGFSIGVIATAAGSADRIIAFDASSALSDFACDRVARRLSSEGVDLDHDDAEGDDEPDYDQLRRDKAMQLAPDRVRAAVDDVTAEWRARVQAFVAALGAVAAGECMILMWDAKNPTL